eukprot:scaffold3477_cov175-Amphora_coffeaeformis.AAC.3
MDNKMLLSLTMIHNDSSAKTLLTDANSEAAAASALRRLAATLKECLVLPSDIVGQVSDDGEVSSGFQAHDLECGWYDNPLLLIIGCRNSFKGTQSFEGVLSPGRHVMHHTTNGACHHHGGRLEMIGTTGWVGVHVQFTELRVLDLVTGDCGVERGEEGMQCNVM